MEGKLDRLPEQFRSQITTAFTLLCVMDIHGDVIVEKFIDVGKSYPRKMTCCFAINFGGGLKQPRRLFRLLNWFNRSWFS